MQFNFKSKIFTVQFTVSNTTPSSYTKVPTSKIQKNARNFCYGYWCHLWVFIGVAFYSKKKGQGHWRIFWAFLAPFSDYVQQKLTQLNQLPNQKKKFQTSDL